MNPNSGRGKGEVIGVRVARYLRSHGLRVDVAMGRDKDQGLAIAHNAVKNGTDALVTVGGDGLVHLGLQATAKTNTPIGIIPCGGGNDIARTLGIPLRKPLAAADLIAKGRSRKIDLGRAGDRWFAGVMATGFDSRVNDRANRSRILKRRWRYDAAMVAELGVFRPISYDITVDGKSWSTDAMLVAVANGPSYGGGMHIVPDADLTDGLFDVMIVKPISKAKFLTVFPRVYRGSHTKLPYVEIVQGAKVEVSAKDVTAYVDGEELGPLPQTMESIPSAVNIFAPRPRHI